MARLIPQALEGCALCATPLRLDAPQGTGSYAIDHDHGVSEKQTAESVRGVLCPGCNAALGGVERFLRQGILDDVLAYLGRARVL